MPVLAHIHQKHIIFNTILCERFSVWLLVVTLAGYAGAILLSRQLWWTFSHWTVSLFSAFSMFNVFFSVHHLHRHHEHRLFLRLPQFSWLYAISCSRAFSSECFNIFFCCYVLQPFGSTTIFFNRIVSGLLLYIEHVK